MTEELKLIEGILAHAEDERTNRSWASDDVGWENVDAIWNKAEQLKELLKKQEVMVNPTKCPCGELFDAKDSSFCPKCGCAYGELSGRYTNIGR